VIRNRRTRQWVARLIERDHPTRTRALVDRVIRIDGTACAKIAVGERR